MPLCHPPNAAHSPKAQAQYQTTPLLNLLRCRSHHSPEFAATTSSSRGAQRPVDPHQSFKTMVKTASSAPLLAATLMWVLLIMGADLVYAHRQHNTLLDPPGGEKALPSEPPPPGVPMVWLKQPPKAPKKEPKKHGKQHEPHKGPDAMAALRQYLQRYGYLDVPPAAETPVIREMGDAIGLFQRSFGLPETRVFDVVTSAAVAQPRCGQPDFVGGRPGRPAARILAPLSGGRRRAIIGMESSFQEAPSVRSSKGGRRMLYVDVPKRAETAAPSRKFSGASKRGEHRELSQGIEPRTPYSRAVEFLAYGEDSEEERVGFASKMPMDMRRGDVVRGRGLVDGTRGYEVGERRRDDDATPLREKKEEFAYFFGNPWWKSRYELTWALSETKVTQRLTRDDIRSAFEYAFRAWAATVPMFSFREVRDYEAADVKISFVAGDHGDSQKFDGVLGIVAHAFSADGRVHFDDAEFWSVDVSTDRAPQALDLSSVAIHEVGHVIGLAHSPVRNSVMYPSIAPHHLRRQLSEDDVQGVQHLYGLDHGLAPNPALEPKVGVNHANDVNLNWSMLISVMVLGLVFT